MEFLTPDGRAALRDAEVGGSGAGNKQLLRQSFQSLFSPTVDGTYDGLASLPMTPAFNVFHGYDENQMVPEMRASISPSPGISKALEALGGGSDENSTSPPLRQAAKEAVAKEFMAMNMFEPVSKPEENKEKEKDSEPRKEVGHINQKRGAPSSEPENHSEMHTQIGQVPSYAVHLGPVGQYGSIAPGQFGHMPVGTIGMMPPPVYMMYCPPGPQPVQPGSTTAKNAKSVPGETPEEKKERELREKEELSREFRKKTREAALVRFRQKKRERKLGKHIRYDCRKKLADARPRVKGRFVRAEEQEPQVVPQVELSESS